MSLYLPPVSEGDALTAAWANAVSEALNALYQAFGPRVEVTPGGVQFPDPPPETLLVQVLAASAADVPVRYAWQEARFDRPAGVFVPSESGSLGLLAGDDWAVSAGPRLAAGDVCVGRREAAGRMTLLASARLDPCDSYCGCPGPCGDGASRTFVVTLAEAAVKAPAAGTAWGCEGGACTAAADGSGQYATRADCERACSPPPDPNGGFVVAAASGCTWEGRWVGGGTIELTFVTSPDEAWRLRLTEAGGGYAEWTTTKGGFDCSTGGTLSAAGPGTWETYDARPSSVPVSQVGKDCVGPWESFVVVSGGGDEYVLAPSRMGTAVPDAPTVKAKRMRSAPYNPPDVKEGQETLARKVNCVYQMAPWGSQLRHAYKRHVGTYCENGNLVDVYKRVRVFARDLCVTAGAEGDPE